MLTSLGLAEMLLAALIIVVAFVVRGITGFGSGLIAIPLLALMLPVSTVVPMVVLLDYLASMSHGIHHFRAIRWKVLLPLLPFTLAGVIAALYLLKSLDMVLLSKALGGFVFVFGIYSLFSRQPRYQGGPLLAIPAGSLGGLVGTLFGTGGPFYVIYLQLRQLDKTAFRATVAMIFLLDGGFRLTGYILSGFYNPQTLWLVAAAMPVMLLALFAGGQIHTGISPLTFRRAIGVILLVSGMALILK